MESDGSQHTGGSPSPWETFYKEQPVTEGALLFDEGRVQRVVPVAHHCFAFSLCPFIHHCLHRVHTCIDSDIID